MIFHIFICIAVYCCFILKFVFHSCGRVKQHMIVLTILYEAPYILKTELLVNNDLTIIIGVVAGVDGKI